MKSSFSKVHARRGCQVCCPTGIGEDCGSPSMCLYTSWIQRLNSHYHPAGQIHFLTTVVFDRIYTTSQRTMHPGPADWDIGLVLPQLRVSPLEECRRFVCVSLKEVSETVASP